MLAKKKESSTKRLLQGKALSERIWELDFFRGIALLLMIYFHVIFDMNEMFSYPVSYTSGINYYTGKISAILFIFISGISSSLSRSNIKRGLRILAIALAISVVTHLYGAEFGIKFGILHFLGTCMLFFPLLNTINNYLLLILGTAAIAAGYFFQRMAVPFNYLFPLGLTSVSFTSADYYPLFPWSGLFIYGIVFGKIFYANKRSLLPFNLSNNFVVRIISSLGKRTLIIYLVHQPVTIAILTLINYFK